jgi:hypothetical protein
MDVRLQWKIDDTIALRFSDVTFYSVSFPDL